MKYPNCFYYDFETYRTKYSNTQEGGQSTLSLEKMMEGSSEIFMQRDISSIFKKKKIILNEWKKLRINHPISEYIIQLIKDGFEVFYMPNQTEALKSGMELKQLSLEYMNTSVTFGVIELNQGYYRNQKIKKQILAKGWNPDEVIILNDQEIYAQIYPDYKKSKNEFIFEFEYLTEYRHSNAISNVCEEVSQAEVVSLSVQTFPVLLPNLEDSDRKYLIEIQEVFGSKKLKVINHYNTLSFHLVPTSFTQNDRQLNVSTLLNLSQEENFDYKKVKTLKVLVESQIIPIELKDLGFENERKVFRIDSTDRVEIDKMFNLELIDIDGDLKVESGVESILHPLELKITISKLSTIQEIHKLFPNIKKLTIKMAFDKYEIMQTDSINGLIFSNVENLSIIYDSNKSKLITTKLLNCFPEKLSQLSLIDQYAWQFNPSMSTPDNSNIIESIVGRFPNLINFCVRGVNLGSLSQSSKVFQLDKLVELTLNSMYLDGDTFTQLLNSSKKSLQSINIRQINEVGKIGNIETNNNLKSISIQDSIIDREYPISIEHDIISNFPYLENIIIGDNSFTNNTNNSPKAYVRNIKKIAVAPFEASVLMSNIILDGNENIEVFIRGFNTTISNKFNAPAIFDIDHCSIDKLDIQNTSMDINSLVWLLTLAKNAHQITFSSLNIFDGPVTNDTLKYIGELSFKNLKNFRLQILDKIRTKYFSDILHKLCHSEYISISDAVIFGIPHYNPKMKKIVIYGSDIIDLNNALKSYDEIDSLEFTSKYNVSRLESIDSDYVKQIDPKQYKMKVRDVAIKRLHKYGPQVEYFLTSSTSVNILKIDTIEIPEGLVQFSHKFKSNIESFSLFNSSIHVVDFIEILKHYPKLKELTLSQVSLFGDIELLNNAVRSNVLEHVYINDSHFTYRGRSARTKSDSREYFDKIIKSINFNSTTIYDGGLEVPKSLTIKDQEIEVDDLISLLIDNKNIESLNLYGLTILGDINLISKSTILSNLKKITLISCKSDIFGADEITRIFSLVAPGAELLNEKNNNTIVFEKTILLMDDLVNGLKWKTYIQILKFKDVQLIGDPNLLYTSPVFMNLKFIAIDNSLHKMSPESSITKLEHIFNKIAVHAIIEENFVDFGKFLSDSKHKDLAIDKNNDNFQLDDRDDGHDSQYTQDKGPISSTSQPNDYIKLPEEKFHLDAKTHSNNPTFNEKIIFKAFGGNEPPNLAFYRLNVFDEIKVNPQLCSSDDICSLEKSFQNNIESCLSEVQYELCLDSGKDIVSKMSSEASLDFYNASYPTIISSDKWLPIASAFIGEKLTHMNVYPPEVEVEIKFNSKDGMHYIRYKSEGEIPVWLDYLLYKPLVDLKLEDDEFNLFPKDLQDLIKHYKGFQGRELVLTSDKLTGSQWLEAMDSQSLGLCRHRTACLLNKIKTENLDLRVRVVNNNMHSFVEVFNNHKWVSVDLGGGVAHLNSLSFNEDDKSDILNHMKSEILNKKAKENKKEKVKKNTVDDLKDSFNKKIASSKLDRSHLPQPLLFSANNTLTEFENDISSRIDLPSEDYITFKKAFKVWNENISRFTEPHLYALSCLKSRIETNEKGIYKKLIQFDSVECSDAFKSVLFKIAKSEDKVRPVFVINYPSQLNVSSSFIQKKEDNPSKAFIQNGPGGPLYDFIVKHVEDDPVFIIDFQHFTKADQIRYNTVIDEVSNVDGFLLPPKSTIIGLLNTGDPNCYQGADFDSRFNNIEKCPVQPDSLNFFETPQEVPLSSGQSNKSVIQLFNMPNWKQKLLGEWKLDFVNGKYELSYVNGMLQNAIQSGLPIEFQNAPWHDPTFRALIVELQTTGHFYQGNYYYLPQDIPLTQSSGYDWQDLKAVLEPFQSSATVQLGVRPSLFLNSSLINLYFEHYEVVEGLGHFSVQKGLIEKNKGQSITITLTDALTDSQYARLLSECQRWNVKLQIQSLAMVPVCPAISQYILTLQSDPIGQFSVKEAVSFISTPNLAPLYIESNDIEATVAKLQKSFLSSLTVNPIVFDVSEFDVSDLFYRLNPIDTLVDNSMSSVLKFEKVESAVSVALKNNETVILKGDFCASLSGEFPAYIQYLLSHQYQGKLILVTYHKKIKPLGLFEVLTDFVTSEDKLDLLGIQDITVRHNLSKVLDESFAQLLTRYQYLSTNSAQSNSDNAWKGMHQLALDGFDFDIDFENSVEKSKKFHSDRVNSVNRVLQCMPYVFLTGISGVGKTSFVENYFDPKKGPHQLFQGDAKLLEWVRSVPNSDGYSVLFWDEANLNPRNFAQFEGMFESPPFILIKGVKYALSDRHKIVFSGNPINYGDDRQLAPFFEKHGGALPFKPLSLSFIYEEVLKPVFSKSKEINRQEMKAICKPVLEAYQFMVELSQTKSEMLISPRELQMIVILALMKIENNRLSLESPTQIIQKEIIRISRSILSASELKQLSQRLELIIDTQVSPVFSRYPSNRAFIHSRNSGLSQYHGEERQSVLGKIGPDYVLTQSRLGCIELLKDLIALREYRQQGVDTLPEQVLRGGLGGFIIEGSPAVGKSEMLYALFKESGLIEDKDYVKIPAGMKIDDKIKKLLEAFHSGKMVIVDEINATPMMENTLNALLMGKTEEGKRADKPGFFIIGTQNPITLGGRVKPSTALSRRLMKEVLPEYTKSEIISILEVKGLDKKTGAEMAQAFLDALVQARARDLKPEPALRHPIRLARKMVEHQQRASLEGSLSAVEQLDRAAPSEHKFRFQPP